MRLLAVAGLVFGTTASAADYRDCKELFVTPLAVGASLTKANGLAWDEGSDADPEVYAWPAERTDVPRRIIGQKMQDTSQPRWSSLFVAQNQFGSWVPVRVGDALMVAVDDRDALADDSMAAFSITVPKELAQTGVAFVQGRAENGTVLSLRISAFNGQRYCAGIEEGAPLVYKVPDGLMARVDAESFKAVASYNRCEVNGHTRACNPDNYTAFYGDVNEDGTPDTIVRGGPFDGGKASVISIALGYEPAKRKEVFVGACEQFGVSKNKELACTTGDKVLLVSVKGKGGVREASAKEAESASDNTAASRAGEARANLKGLFTAQKAYFQEMSKYSTNANAVGFTPERGNRYTYFLAPRGQVQARASAALAFQTEISIISADQLAYPGITVPTSLKEAGCPLTFGENKDGEPVGLGVSGSGTEMHFTAYAIGNVDADPDFDCWSISSIDRKTKAGKTIPAGEPYHERSDFQESVAASDAP